MYDTVLVAVAGDESDPVVTNAIDLAERHDARLVVLSVVDDRAFLTLDDDLAAEVEAELREEAETQVGAVADRTADAAIEAEGVVERGSPADEILACAQRTGADCIVVGTRGDDYESRLVGSVSRDVLSRARVPTLVVPLR